MFLKFQSADRGVPFSSPVERINTQETKYTSNSIAKPSMCGIESLETTETTQNEGTYASPWECLRYQNIQDELSRWKLWLIVLAPGLVV